MMCHRIKGGVIKNGNPGTVVSKPGYTLGSTNVAIEKWTLNEDDSPNKNGDIPASYVSLPESKLGISPFSLGESSSFRVHSPIAMLVYQRDLSIIFTPAGRRPLALAPATAPSPAAGAASFRPWAAERLVGNFREISPWPLKKKVVKTPS